MEVLTSEQVFNNKKKDGKGSQFNKLYKITYTLTKNPQLRLCTTLICLGVLDNEKRKKYAFIDGYDTPYINNNRDRTEFLNEFYEFQTGSRYRKTHPIPETTAEKLNKERKELLEKIQNIDNELNTIRKTQKDILIEDAFNQVDKKSLDKYIKQVVPIFNNKNYSICMELRLNSTKVIINDSRLNIPVAELCFSNRNDNYTVEKYTLEKIKEDMY